MKFSKREISFWLKKTLKEVGQKPWSIMHHVVIKFQHDGILISDESPYQRIVYIFRIS